MSFIRITENYLKLAKEWLSSSAREERGHPKIFILIDYYVNSELPYFFDRNYFKDEIDLLEAAGNDINGAKFFTIYKLAKECSEIYSKEISPLLRPSYQDDDLDNHLITKGEIGKLIHEHEGKLTEYTIPVSDKDNLKLITLSHLGYYADDIFKSIKDLADWQELEAAEIKSKLAIGKWDVLGLMEFYLSRLELLPVNYKEDENKTIIYSVKSLSIAKDRLDEKFGTELNQLKEELEKAFANKKEFQQKIELRSIRSKIEIIKNRTTVMKNLLAGHGKGSFFNDRFYLSEIDETNNFYYTGEELFKCFESKISIYERELSLVFALSNSKAKPIESELNNGVDKEVLFNESEIKENKIKILDNGDILSSIAVAENKFWKGLPMDVVVNHFMIMTTRKNKNNLPFLTKEQLVSFLKKGFLNDEKQSIQKISCGSAEKGFAISRFYGLFELAVSQYAHPNKKRKFISMFMNCFDNWELSTVEAYFKPNKTNEKW